MSITVNNIANRLRLTNIWVWTLTTVLHRLEANLKNPKTPLKKDG